MFSPWYFVVTLLCFEVIQCKICDLLDEQCAVKVSQKNFPHIVAKIPEPLIRNKIIGDLPTVKFVYEDTNSSGFKDCFVTKVSIRPATQQTQKFPFDYYLECPKLTFNAEHYTMKGNLGPINVDGEGSCTIVARDYVFKLSGHYESVLGDDRKQHYRVTDHKVEADSKGGVTFNFQNLVRGDQKKSDAALKSLNENWETVDKTLQGPTISSFFDVFVHNMNEYFASTPVDTVSNIN